jgi:hypothetical protein
VIWLGSLGWENALECSRMNYVDDAWVLEHDVYASRCKEMRLC